MGNVSKRQQPDHRAEKSRRSPMGLQCSQILPHPQASFSWSLQNMYISTVIMDVILNSEVKIMTQCSLLYSNFDTFTYYVCLLYNKIYRNITQYTNMSSIKANQLFAIVRLRKLDKDIKFDLCKGHIHFLINLSNLKTSWKPFNNICHYPLDFHFYISFTKCIKCHQIVVLQNRNLNKISIYNFNTFFFVHLKSNHI